MSLLEENKDSVGKISQGTPTDLDTVLKAIEECKRETNVQLVRVGRRLNVLEKRVLGTEGESELESDNVDAEDNASTDAYGFGAYHGRQRCLMKKKLTASPLGNPRRIRHDNGNNSGFSAIQSDDLQAEFQSIRDNVARQRLPKDLKFVGSVRGVKAQSHDAVKALSISGKYVETAIKVASTIQSKKDECDYDVTSDIEDLLICLIAHMRVLQEKHCLILVGGNYGPRTQQIFCTIHANPAQYTPTVVEELRTSAALAALPQENTIGTGGQGEGRGFRGNFRSDYRSGFRFNGQRGRGNSQGNNYSWNNDYNPGFRNRQVPTERQTED